MPHIRILHVLGVAVLAAASPGFADVLADTGAGTVADTAVNTGVDVAAAATDPGMAPDGDTPTAYDLVAGAIDLTRGRSSYTEMSMTIHRPDWQRTSSLVAWSRGREDALIRFTAPAKDAGNATLKQGEKMWTFTPKLNRTIRLPYSLMSQSWAGSDFSYNDLSRTDNLLHHYELTIAAVEQRDGHTVYTIDAVPHDDAPVVWGKETMELRDDYVLLAQTYYDQGMEPLKRLESLEVGELGGRVFSTRMRMLDLEEPDRWTEIRYDMADFDIEVEDKMFTVFALKSSG